MIDAIKKLGEYVKNNKTNKKEILELLCLTLPEKVIKDKKEYKQHVVFLNFDTTNKTIDIEYEEVNAGGKDSGREYLWVGNNKANKPQVYFTTNKLEYLLTDSLKNIIKTLEKLENKNKVNGGLKNCLDNVLKIFFEECDCGFYIKPCIIFNNISNNINKNNINSTGLSKKEKKISFEEMIKEEKKELLSSKKLKDNEIARYTVKLNGELACNFTEYVDMVYYEKIEQLFDSKGSYKKNLQTAGICSVCDKKNISTTSDTTNLQFKYYITDKLGFSSNLDEKFIKNYNICKECYIDLMIGENFVKNNLKSRIGDLYVYIIPYFIFKTTTLNIKDFAEYIKQTSNSIVNLKSFKGFQDMLSEYKEYEDEKNYFIINYLFYHESKSEFKILKLIKDIPPSRLDIIRKMEEDINKLFEKEENLKVNLEGVYRCIPIKKDNYYGFSKFLEVIDNIFSNTLVDYNFLINQFTEVIRILKFKREGYNIWVDTDFEHKILQMNLVLLFFKKLNILGGNMINSNVTNVGENNLPNEILEYWKNLEIYNDDCKRALFLLGYLIGEVGRAQDTKYIKNRPVLNKINFQGMGVEKLIRLSNDIFEKLIQYDKLRYNENIYSVLKQKIDKNIKEWSLSNQENVFYILSGYAFSDYIVLEKYIKYKSSIEEKIEQKEKEIQEMEGKGKDVTKQKELLCEAKKKFKEEKYKDANESLEKINVTTDGKKDE
jgi:CRISPR-associated protein Csh1